MSGTAPTGTLYRCVFDRIGRNRDVEPATFRLPDLDALPEAVGKHVRPYMLSRDYEIEVFTGQDGAVLGRILAGVRDAGTFVVMVQPMTPPLQPPTPVHRMSATATSRTTCGVSTDTLPLDTPITVTWGRAHVTCPECQPPTDRTESE